MNNESFLIDYIDNERVELVHTNTFKKIKLKIGENGSIGSVTRIVILSRSPVEGYARQHKLVTGTWVDILLQDEVSLILTCEITNLEEDMIELKTTDGDVLFINFDYKGIPENIPIMWIKRREKPNLVKKVDVQPSEKEAALGEDKEVKDAAGEDEFPPESGFVDDDDYADTKPKKKEQVEGVERVEGEGQLLEEGDDDIYDFQPVQQFKDKLRELIIDADKFTILDEEVDVVTQYVDVSTKTQRFSLETQVNDLLDDMLSTIPTYKRNNNVLGEINRKIERFKQLRESYSIFDVNGNITGFNRMSNSKPLVNYLTKFDCILYWILPVVSNIKKVYETPADDFDSFDDIEIIDLNEDLTQLQEVIAGYSSNTSTDTNKYSFLYKKLASKFIPYINTESTEHSIQTDIHAVVDNLDIVDNSNDTYSSVVKDNKIVARRFLTQQYNLGIKRPYIDNKQTKFDMLIDDEKMCVKSIMMLPEPVILYSKIRTPNTSIIERANLNQTFHNLWELLRHDTKVTRTNVTDAGILFDENNFIKNINHFTFTDQIDYTKFTDKITPELSVFFNLMQKHMNNKLTIVDAINIMEPFLIYSENLTFAEYQLIAPFIDQRVSEYNKSLLTKAGYFSALKRAKNKWSVQSSSSLHALLNDFKSVRDVFDIYKKDASVSSETEVLSNMYVIDNSRLFNAALSLKHKTLMFPDDFAGLLNPEKQPNRSETDIVEKCDSVVIAKKYRSPEELEADNNRAIYFDKRYDTTKYSLIDGYEYQISTMQTDEFEAYLINDLAKKFKLNEVDSKKLAFTLINGYKQVDEGHYALLYKGHRDNVNDEFDYYKRTNNAWLKVDSPVDKVITDDSDLICNLQDKCVSVVADKCITDQQNKLNIKNKLMNDLIGEFDDKYKLTKEETATKLQNEFDYQLSIADALRDIRNANIMKHNDYKYKLFYAEDDEVVIVSPSIKLRDLILSQTDFDKKQDDIVRFVNSYTRQYIPIDVNESPHWLYCNITNTKLLPKFKHDLALAHLRGGQYSECLERLKNEIGEISDDGDKWIDKHSGWILSMIDLDIEEGYDAAGFKQVTRSAMQADLDVVSTHDQTQPQTKTSVVKFNTPQAIMISNIVNEISNSMGISLNHQIDFIVSCVLSIIRGIESEKQYTEREMSSTKKNKMTYKEYSNSTILYSTLGMIVIAIQTSMPSLRTRKTYPGCVKSFSGFPMEGNGDFSSVQYLACIVYQMRKSKRDPWNVLLNTKDSVITERIKMTISANLLTLPDVKRKIDEKIHNMIENPEENEALKQHNVVKWKNFLPPLFVFQVKTTNKLSREFLENLKKDLKGDLGKQGEKILTIDSKRIHFSMAIQQKIQAVVNRKELILKNSNNEPFLENACCGEVAGKTTIRYFENEDSDIADYNQVVKQLSLMLDDLNGYTRASMFLPNSKTKRDIPVTNNVFDESTIYLAFVQFCKFKTASPVPSDIAVLCGEKPEDGLLTGSDSLLEIIRKLKNDNRNYDNASFLRLLQLVSRANIIQAASVQPKLSYIGKIRRIVDSLKDDDNSTSTSIVDTKIIKLLSNVIDTYDIASEEISEETKQLNDELFEDNKLLRSKIIKFITDHRGIASKKSINSVFTFINTLSKWSADDYKFNPEINISHDSMYSSVTFFKTFIDNITKVFPNIILNKGDYEISEKQLASWNLSSSHATELTSAINAYYDKFKPLYEVPVLSGVLRRIQTDTDKFIQLITTTPSLTTIQYNGKTIRPIFDETTSKYLFEYYLLTILGHYVDLCDDDEVLQEDNRTSMESGLFSVGHMNSLVDDVNYNDDDDNGVSLEYQLTGDKTQLKGYVVKLLITYCSIMQNYKDNMDYSHEDIVERIFKMKQKEKNMVTSRLGSMTDEERNADTILKINKLGVWNKGLQKGLTRYDKKTYDDEKVLAENMERIERDLHKKNKSNKTTQDMDDYLEENEAAEFEDNEIYNMSTLNQDYDDGGIDEVENYGEDD